MLRGRFRGSKKSSSSSKGSGQIQAIIFMAAILMAMLSPLIATLIKLAISRNREYLADSSAAGMTRNPLGLAKALEKISQDKEPLEAANKATAHLYIANPLKNRHDAIGMFANMFSTHPPVEKRIEALRSL